MFPISSGQQRRKYEQSLIECSSHQPEYNLRPIATVNPSVTTCNTSEMYDTFPTYAPVESTSQHTSASNISKLPYYALPSYSETAGSTSFVGHTSETEQKPYLSNPLFAAYPEYTSHTEPQTQKNPSSRYQPRVKQDSHAQRTPYSGAKGMHLLQKMGWNPGQGLGKRKDGSLEPYVWNIKVNQRSFDIAKKTQPPVRKWSKYKQQFPKSKTSGAIHIVTEGKNPISILDEYCKKKKCASPCYEAIVDEGPIHAKNYVFKVVVEGVEYCAQIGSNVKNKAKAEAATVCLKKLGILSA